MSDPTEKDFWTVVPGKLYELDAVAKDPDWPEVSVTHVDPLVDLEKVTDAAAELMR